MKKTFMTSIVLAIFLFVSGLTNTALAQSTDNGSLSAPVKPAKKAKKTKKKSKKSSSKVSKTPAGEQDEVSDQADVSQQADKSKTKKKR